MKKQFLMIPGPTPVPHEAALAGARPMINHRGPEFGELLRDVTVMLQAVMRTKNPVLVFPSAGTGGMEAAAVNLIAPGDGVLVLVAGEFGARFAEIARAVGGSVKTVESEPGKPIDARAVRQALDADSSIKIVIATHNETSTGVTMDLPALRSAIARDDILFVVDAVSSLGSIELRTDEWGIDVVVAASQKGLMTPPGLAIVSVSEKAWARAASVPARSVYWSFAQAKRYYDHPSPQTPYTPAVSLLAALRESLKLMQAEGADAVLARHAVVARAIRAGVRALGLETLAEDAWASNTVTAVKVPQWLDGRKFPAVLRDRYGVIIAGGMGPLAGRIFRIGHVGYVDWSDVVVTLAAIEMACRDLGGQVRLGSAVAAAEEVLAAGR